jgi:hypothetical protein
MYVAVPVRFTSRCCHLTYATWFHLLSPISLLLSILSILATASCRKQVQT